MPPLFMYVFFGGEIFVCVSQIFQRDICLSLVIIFFYWKLFVEYLYELTVSNWVLPKVLPPVILTTVLCTLHICSRLWGAIGKEFRSSSSPAHKSHLCVCYHHSSYETILCASENSQLCSCWSVFSSPSWSSQFSLLAIIKKSIDILDQID